MPPEPKLRDADLEFERGLVKLRDAASRCSCLGGEPCVVRKTERGQPCHDFTQHALHSLLRSLSLKPFTSSPVLATFIVVAGVSIQS